MEDLLAEVERAVRARGWSARQASMMAVGTPELIRDMRRGRVPSVERFRALCEVLGLEFYVGPPRDNVRLSDLRRLERAIQVTESVLAARARNLTREQKAQVVSETYHLIGEDLRAVGAGLVTQLIDLAEAGIRSSGPTIRVSLPSADLPMRTPQLGFGKSQLRKQSPRQ